MEITTITTVVVAAITMRIMLSNTGFVIIAAAVRLAQGRAVAVPIHKALYSEAVTVNLNSRVSLMDTLIFL